MSKAYKTPEFYSKMGDLVGEFATTQEDMTALFKARNNGTLPPIFAEDENQHLERLRHQLEEWTFER